MYKLTSREKEILEWSILYSQQEVANKLSLSSRTVEWYLKRVYRKMNVTKIQTAICVALRDGHISNIV